MIIIYKSHPYFFSTVKDYKFIILDLNLVKVFFFVIEKEESKLKFHLKKNISKKFCFSLN